MHCPPCTGDTRWLKRGWIAGHTIKHTLCEILTFLETAHLWRHDFYQLIQKSVFSNFIMKPSPAVLHARFQYLRTKSLRLSVCFSRCLLTYTELKFFLLSKPEEPPILVASGFCGRGELRLFGDCKRKFQVRNVFWGSSQNVWVFFGKHFADIPFQLLVDLVAEAYDVLPVLLSVSWMGGFIC